MADIVWQLPFPSSSLASVDFQKLAGRSCVLSCRHDDYGLVRVIFDGVEAFKCTYHLPCTVDMIETYDKLTDLGVTLWLSSIQQQLSENGSDGRTLHHLMIYFDDGPCYEFICRSYRVENEGARRCCTNKEE
jgi:hypothetical protein